MLNQEHIYIILGVIKYIVHDLTKFAMILFNQHHIIFTKQGWTYFSHFHLRLELIGELLCFCLFLLHQAFAKRGTSRWWCFLAVEYHMINVVISKIWRGGGGHARTHTRHNTKLHAKTRTEFHTIHHTNPHTSIPELVPKTNTRTSNTIHTIHHTKPRTRAHMPNSHQSTYPTSYQNSCQTSGYISIFFSYLKSIRPWQDNGKWESCVRIFYTYHIFSLRESSLLFITMRDKSASRGTKSLSTMHNSCKHKQENNKDIWWH